MKILKYYLSKIIFAAFLFMLFYSQCGYAIIEKYLVPAGEGNLYDLGNTYKPVEIETKELAVEIAEYLRNGRLRKMYIDLGEEHELRQLFLGMLTEVLPLNLALTTLSFGNNNIDDEGARIIAYIFRHNSVLTTLNLGNNDIGDAGALALAKALSHNPSLITLYLWGNDIGSEGTKAIIAALVDNYNLLKLYGLECEKILLRNELLIKLLRKIKGASAFTSINQFKGIRFERLGMLVPVVPDAIARNILEFAGLNVQNIDAFANVQNYNNENTRRIIFGGSIEEIIRLFYYGDRANYVEIIREVNQIRQLQREIFQENRREMPEGWLQELPETPSIMFVPERVATIFWTS